MFFYSLSWVYSVFYVSDTFQVWGYGFHVRQIINIFLIHARFHGVLRFRHEFLQTAIPRWSTSKFWSRHELGMSCRLTIHTACMHDTYQYIHTYIRTQTDRQTDRHTYISYHIISYYNAYDVTIRILDMDTVIQIHIKCMWKLSHWKPSVA